MEEESEKLEDLISNVWRERGERERERGEI
jgi:hypothetical protein